MLCRKNNPRLNELKEITNLEQLKGFRIAEYLGNGWAERNLKGMQVEWLPDIEQIFSFLLLDRADLVVASNKTIYTLEKKEYKDQFVIMPHKLSSVSFHLCIGKNSPYKNRLEDFDRVFSQMKNEGMIDEIERSYYH